MKEVYKIKVQFVAYFDDGKILKSPWVYNKYAYGEKPNNSVEEHPDSNACFNELLKKLGHPEHYRGKESFFRRRLFVEEYYLFTNRIYKDRLVGWDMYIRYESEENPMIKKLQEDLDFNTYAELLADKICLLNSLHE